MKHASNSARDDLEREIVENFVLPERTERMLFLQAKRREEFVASFHTEKFLDLAAAKLVSASMDVLALMRQAGASDECYAVSSQQRLDARTLPLSEALENCMGTSIETVLISPGTGIGYYEGGGYSDRYILISRSETANRSFKRTPGGAT
jgi:hypothetical protein